MFIASDHFRISTIKRLAKERPSLRWACCEWMVPHLVGIVNPKKIDILSDVVWHDYKSFKVSPFKLYHNVPNCGYRLDFDGYRIFYATDTGTLDGIEAKDYDLYMIEANHLRDEIEARAQAKIERGEFAYEVAAAENHLSKEQADDFIYQNIGANGQYVYLHQHEDK